MTRKNGMGCTRFQFSWGAFVLGLGLVFQFPVWANFRPFNDTSFTVAYDVFLASGNIQAAFELASEVVRQKPDQMEWHKRLANTAEWVGKPEYAQREWEFVGKASNDPQAFQSAIRLAQILRDPKSAARAWEGLATIQELNPTEWIQWIDAYENSGEPEKCVIRLRQQLKYRHDKTLAIRLVQILMRSDRDNEALGELEKLSIRYGNTMETCLRRAEIYCRKGQVRQAANILDSIPLLQNSQAQSDSMRISLLRLQATVYSWMQRDRDALAAYRNLFQAGKYNADDLRHINLIARSSDPDLAIHAAIAGWLKFQDPDHLIYYLERCIEAERWDLASRMLSKLTHDQWEKCSETTYFYVLAARIHQFEGKTTLARSEYLIALERDPGIEDFQAGYLWLLIEQGRLSELSNVSHTLAKGSATPKVLLEPLAMAFKLLQRHSLSLAYFRMIDANRENADFPFLLSYGELLEQAGDGGGAEQAYLRAQRALENARSHNEIRQDREWQESLFRWFKKFGSSDTTANRLSALTKRYQGGGGTKEWDFSWRTERGQNSDEALAALGGQEKSFPAWARLAIAMRQNNWGRIRQLLDNRESGLGDEDRAQAAAFLGIQKRRGLPVLGGGVSVNQHPYFTERKATMELQTVLAERTTLLASAQSSDRPWVSQNLNLYVPSREMAGAIEIKYVTRQTETKMSLGIRQTSQFANGKTSKLTQSMALEANWVPIKEIQISSGLETNSLAEENPILALVGLKDEGHIGLVFRLPADIQWEWKWAHLIFHSRENRRLGDGSYLKSNISHRLFSFLSTGLTLGYYPFHEAAMSMAPEDQNKIGGLLSPGQFPQTLWHSSIFGEWVNRNPSQKSWTFSPLGSFELGRNIFPATHNASSVATNEFSLRGGVHLHIRASQRLTLESKYARGLQGRQETEKSLSLNYGQTFR